MDPQVAVAPLVGALDRVVVEVTGEDRLTYLDDVLSQRLRDVSAPLATSALELGPHGEPNGVLDVAVLEDRVVLLVPDALAEELIGRLAGRTFLAEATFEQRDDLSTLRIRGAADEVLTSLGVGDEHGELNLDTGHGTDEPVLWLRWRHGADVVVPAGAVDRVREAVVAAGASAATTEELDAAEIAAGVPRAPEEIAKGRLPEELGLLPTHVHLDKGCYPGQEAVARMWQLGRPRRRLAVVALPEGTEPGHVVDEAGAAEVTRTAQVADQTLGLAFVGRDTTAGDLLHGLVDVLAIVGTDLPVPGRDPSVKRRRDR